MYIKTIKIFVKEKVTKITSFISGVPKVLIIFVNNYCDNRLYLRTAKRIGNYNFIKLIYYEIIVKRLVNPIRQIYYPSKVSLIVTVGLSFVLFYLPGKSPENFVEYIDTNHYQNFIAVHAAIGAIILAFLILIAETSDSGKNQDKARLVLKETWLFPLATAEIISLTLYICGGKELGNVISVFVIAFLTIRAIYKIIQLFINRQLFQEKERDLVNDRFSKMVDQSIMERVENNTLMEYLEQSKYEIDYSYFSVKRDDLKPIFIGKNGVLTDINLGKLEKLLYEIDKVASKYGLTIKKNPFKSKQAIQTSHIVDLKNEKNTVIGVSILKLIGHILNEDNQKIFSLPKTLYDDKDLKLIIEKEIRSIFIIKPQNNFEKEIRFELDELKDVAMDAVLNSKISMLGSVMSTYISLVGNFLEVFKKYGDGYTHEDAIKEMNSIFGGWSYLRWIKEDFFDILTDVIRSGKDKLIKDVIHIPIEIAYKAFQQRDHLVFLEFIRYQSVLYLESNKIKNKDVRKYLIDRSSRYLKEFCDYRIVPEIEDPDIKLKDITNMRDFVFEVLQTYKYLIKYSFDRKNVHVFGNYLNDVQGIMKRFSPSKEYKRVTIELQLNSTNITEKQRVELKDNLEKINNLEEVEKQIADKKSELSFGLATWCLYKLEKLNFSDQKILDIWNKLLPYLPKELNSLIKIHELCHSDRVENFWGWDWWELEDRRGNQDGVITTEITFDRKLDLLLAIMLLKVLKGKNENQVDISNIHVSRDLSVYIGNNDGGIKKQVNDICANRTPWDKIISSEEFASKDIVLSLLDKLVDKQKQEEINALIDTPIDQNKVNEFIDNFVEAYNKRIGIRKLLSIFGVLKTTTSTQKGKKYWGFNEIQDKESFISSPYTDYSGWGEHYGEGLAESEDQIIFNKLNANSTKLVLNDISLGDGIIKAMDVLQSKNLNPSVIFITFYIGEWQRLNFNNTEFIPSYKIKDGKFKLIPNFVGLYKHNSKKIPIYHIWTHGGDSKKEIFVSDLSNFIELKQYPPYSTKKEKKDMQLKDSFAFKITDLSTDGEQRNELVTRNPSWLQKYADKESYLKQKVIVHVKEKFDLNIKNKEASMKIIINSTEPEEV